jgi:hypothetical protein
MVWPHSPATHSSIHCHTLEISILVRTCHWYHPQRKLCPCLALRHLHTVQAVPCCIMFTRHAQLVSRHQRPVITSHSCHLCGISVERFHCWQSRTSARHDSLLRLCLATLHNTIEDGCTTCHRACLCTLDVLYCRCFTHQCMPLCYRARTVSVHSFGTNLSKRKNVRTAHAPHGAGRAGCDSWGWCGGQACCSTGCSNSNR